MMLIVFPFDLAFGWSSNPGACSVSSLMCGFSHTICQSALPVACLGKEMGIMEMEDSIDGEVN